MEYIVITQRGDNEDAREYEHVEAECSEDAEQDALSLSDELRTIAVYERVR